MGGKLGVAALGYMAYRAYQDQQSKSGASAGSSGSARGGSGLSGMVQDVVNSVTGGSQSHAGGTPAAANEEDMREEAQAAENLSDDTALLLIRAMITAAYSDGSLSTDERQRIMGEIDSAGGDAEDRAIMEREIANPKPLDELLTKVNDEETAEEFYMASRAAVDGETEPNRAYLADLQRRLSLSDEQVAEVEEMVT